MSSTVFIHSLNRIRKVIRSLRSLVRFPILLSQLVNKNRAKFPHSPILHMHYACRSLLTENNSKNNATGVELCAVFVVSWLRNKGLHILNRMHNEVWAVRKFCQKSFARTFHKVISVFFISKQSIYSTCGTVLSYGSRCFTTFYDSPDAIALALEISYEDMFLFVWFDMFLFRREEKHVYICYVQEIRD